MKYQRVMASGIYSIAQISFGLLVHPYQTMQSLVTDQVFVWLTLIPTFTLAGVTIMWRWLVVPAVRLVFSCHTSQFFACDFLPFLSNWITFFCIYWQILLLYLLFRFRTVFKN